MRTTLDVDDRVLAAARSRARVRGTTIGQALSELALRGLVNEAEGQDAPLVAATGFPTLPYVVGHVITDEMVERALTEDG